ncbi:SRPBCC domain-containing protein [Paenibacillus athensensis]|uniref:Activator of Hsp90 ATPase homologue 1/2-like C-terminal domain-containing protein n=1 Tax=Paenibacillus athensensis TaxID=1967502 RepID=A0A4Y8QCC9_9BACL|nr:SRPBCC domain-containing protein [Paenibacillus athensensis]MCD1257590.1 SRPBCC domain-containing protein [Paenibacillus athensensis]
MVTERITGQTAAAGFQIGVRKTLAATREQLWNWLLSRQGLGHWLGELDELPLESGLRYETEEGVTGEVRVVKLQEQLRLTWQPPGWLAPSTVQIRLLAAAEDKTTLSFHQEKLRDAAARERMKQRWEAAIAAAQAAVTEMNG